MIRNKIFLFAVLATIALFNVSCKKSNGGGFIASAEPGGNGKATIGFQLKCDNILHSSGNYVAQVTGSVQFNDHPAGVKVHGDINFIPYDFDTNFNSCEVIAAQMNGGLPNTDSSAGIGTYSNVAGQHGGISFAVRQIPANDACPSGNEFAIALSGDIDYRNRGCLDGGNLTIF